MKESIFSKKKILLLGSGELGKELVIESKRLGLEVIAIDKYVVCLCSSFLHAKHLFFGFLL